ncbi:Ktr system potassium uptake protein B [Austwickia sp. TVS 96-490-7B]|uniref:TrkH family potassium uptake protein n=1 Tax=Austwickia sp. TVS 96-490-7B TaxID=2830843 RepID=UPI001DAE596B|nr:potassium transporter TrkG [Austwickia sp. TVS 96-490-7B]MBW3084238.1 Ktr system potassium uptake protein B [Austwickia sp. TVS 96-490-7B]
MRRNDAPATTWRYDANRRWVRALTRPVRLVPLSFVAAITVGTLLLLLPLSHANGEVDAMAAAFTAVSAVCVTGLATVDTATYWTPFGQVVILALIQVGGFGIMTLATLLSLLVRGRMGVSDQLVVRAESRAFETGGSVTGLIRRIAVRMFAAEAIIAVLLTLRFRSSYHDSWGEAAWHGVFHAVSAFNNAGFALYSDNLTRFVGDPFICVPICMAIIAGGIGYPVYFELVQRWRRPRQWSVHTRITVGGTVLLLTLGMLSYLIFEWTNPRTMGSLSLWEKMIAAGTASVVARTAGFNTIDYGAITGATLVITLVLMFVGGGSAGTAGGIKVTTFFLLGFLILAEARGDQDVVVGRRRIGPAAQRQAVTVALLGVGAVTAGTIAMVVITGMPLDAVTFETVSAFATVGLSTGITPRLDVPAQIVIMVLMFTGRVGTITLASALALRSRQRHYHYPQERPIVG